MDRQRLIERVQKLQERATLDTGEERQRAAEEAARLIAKHEITAEELRTGGRNRFAEARRQAEAEVPSGFGSLDAGPWPKGVEGALVANLITTFFESTVVRHHDRAHIVGPKLCVACDIKRWRELLLLFEGAWQQHRVVGLVYRPFDLFGRRGPLFQPSRPSYLFGLFEGLRAGLLEWRLGQIRSAASALQLRQMRGERVDWLIPSPRLPKEPNRGYRDDGPAPSQPAEEDAPARPAEAAPGAAQEPQEGPEEDDPERLNLGTPSPEDIKAGLRAGRELAARIIPRARQVRPHRSPVVFAPWPTPRDPDEHRFVFRHEPIIPRKDPWEP